MRVSKTVRLGLSGTSLALATLAGIGCAKENSLATKEELRPQAYRMEQAVGAILEEQERDQVRQREADRAVSLNAEQPVDASSPWFLKPAGAADGPRDSLSRPVADVSDQQQPAIVVGEPGKPKPAVTPPVQPRRPPGWQIRAACGRG